MPSELLEAILSAPDRDSCPGARAVVAYDKDDDAEFLAEVEERAVLHAPLDRRGLWHGRLAALERHDDAPDETLAERWDEARPIVLPGVIAKDVAEQPEVVFEALEAYRALARPGALRPWVQNRLGDLSPELRVLPTDPPLADPERDVERVGLAHADAQDLWLKTSRLSTHDEDESLRLRFSFGEEEVDDANPDPLRSRLVTRLAEQLLPGCPLVHGATEVASILEYFCDAKPRFSQHIAYWNAPGGGALFHHDSFDEPYEDRQLGVFYTQVSGNTAWLALSIDDLADRVREFADGWEEPDMEGVVEPARLGELLDDPDALLRELSLPGCGDLAHLVNLGPDFTCFLADAGHAFLLEPGDVILLPNHGYERTAMHSVFCASSRPTYGISLAVRAEPD